MWLKCTLFRILKETDTERIRGMKNCRWDVSMEMIWIILKRCFRHHLMAWMKDNIYTCKTWVNFYLIYEIWHCWMLCISQTCWQVTMHQIFSYAYSYSYIMEKKPIYAECVWQERGNWKKVKKERRKKNDWKFPAFLEQHCILTYKQAHTDMYVHHTQYNRKRKGKCHNINQPGHKSKRSCFTQTPQGWAYIYTCTNGPWNIYTHSVQAATLNHRPIFKPSLSWQHQYQQQSSIWMDVASKSDPKLFCWEILIKCSWLTAK